MSAEERPSAVVVGVDGTPAAHAALEWAAEAAARRGAQLRIVHGMGEPSVVATHGSPERRAAARRRSGTRGTWWRTQPTWYAARIRGWTW
nr:universal stress protein [Nocardiopsis sp. CNR-923]